MKNALLIIFICSLLSCSNERSNNDYFHIGELSNEPYTDSLMRHKYSSDLVKLKELPLRNTLASYTIRLSVFSAFHDSYCIRIDKLDSSVFVTLKVLGDGPTFRPSGLNNLSMTYESRHAKMDSLFSELYSTAGKYFSTQHDKSKIGADGVVYLLESLDNGTYHVVTGWSAGSLTNDPLLSLAFKIQSFVPVILLPAAQNLYKEGWFPVFNSRTSN